MNYQRFFAGILYCDADLDDVCFLHNGVYVSLLGFLLMEGLNFIIALIEGATNLETLVLDQWDEDDEHIYLSDFCESFFSYAEIGV